MTEIFSPSLLRLRSIVEDVTRNVIAPASQEVDNLGIWPEHSMRALADAGLLGLHLPKKFGGHEEGLLALALLSETIAQGCASSALCYAMHCVGSAVIATKATSYQEERYLQPIAENRHITTLALSEPGSGAHFYLPQTRLSLQGAEYEISGTKHFVTSGGYADSYVISTMASDDAAQPGEFSCLVIDHNTPGISWGEPWNGFGMRGNASRAVIFDGLRIPVANLLGEEGDQIWYFFEVVAPYFLIAMAGTYTGIAQAALNLTVKHLQNRYYHHSGERLSDLGILQHRVAELSISVNRTRQLLYRASTLGDQGDEQAMMTIMMAKVEAAETAVRVANEAMTCCGGIAYRGNSLLSRFLRDARASHVMSPTTDLLKSWIGRLQMELPLF